MTPRQLEGLSAAERAAILNRSMEDIAGIYPAVAEIVAGVRSGGDPYLAAHCMDFEGGVTPGQFEVSRAEMAAAYEQVAVPVVDALKAAAANITRFHEAQRERPMWGLEIREGILAGRLTRPMDRVGCYIPGGRAAYPSTILMTVLPARVAGVGEVVAVTPPGPGLSVNPAILVAAHIAGVDRLFRIGGPWGIAAMAWGTATVPAVDKIVGPGNKYVTAAKMLVYGRVDIDSPAGPSEALILADAGANPEFIAADFLSQAEHDPDSAAVLVTPAMELAEAVCTLLNRRFEALPRKAILAEALTRHSCVLVARDMAAAVAFANEYGAEHLQIMTAEPFMTLNRIRHAGSIFLGPYSPVAAGDYASGTNHVLPTGRCARMFSGLSVDDFVKKPTFQYLSREGLASLKDTIVTLAEAEGLPLHARSVMARFD